MTGGRAAQACSKGMPRKGDARSPKGVNKRPERLSPSGMGSGTIFVAMSARWARDGWLSIAVGVSCRKNRVGVPEGLPHAGTTGQKSSRQ